MAKRKGTPYVERAQPGLAEAPLQIRRQECGGRRVASSVGQRSQDMGALLLAGSGAGRPGCSPGASARASTMRERRAWSREARGGEPRQDQARVARAAGDEGRPVGRRHEARRRVRLRRVDADRRGSMRHPVRFIGLREDKEPMECLKDAPDGDPSPERDEQAPPAAAPPRATKAEAPKLTNAHKTLFPRDALTKRQRVGLLHGDRARDAPAPVRQAADDAALPRRDRRRGVVPAERAVQGAVVRSPGGLGAAPREQEADRLRLARHSALAVRTSLALHRSTSGRATSLRGRRRARRSTTRSGYRTTSSSISIPATGRGRIWSRWPAR